MDKNKIIDRAINEAKKVYKDHDNNLRPKLNEDLVTIQKFDSRMDNKKANDFKHEAKNHMLTLSDLIDYFESCRPINTQSK